MKINLICVWYPGTYIRSLMSLAFIVSEIDAFKQTDMAQSTRLLILIIYYILFGVCHAPSAFDIHSAKHIIPFLDPVLKKSTGVYWVCFTEYVRNRQKENSSISIHLSVCLYEHLEL